VRKADNLQTSCADVKKSGSLNLLEPCGPVQACNGTALHRILLRWWLYIKLPQIDNYNKVFKLK
jgi:hypothetical protein